MKSKWNCEDLIKDMSKDGGRNTRICSLKCGIQNGKATWEGIRSSSQKQIYAIRTADSWNLETCQLPLLIACTQRAQLKISPKSAILVPNIFTDLAMRRDREEPRVCYGKPFTDLALFDRFLWVGEDSSIKIIIQQREFSSASNEHTYTSRNSKSRNLASLSKSYGPRKFQFSHLDFGCGTISIWKLSSFQSCC